MNRFGKVLLVATSLTPIFLVCFVKSLIPDHDPATGGKTWAPGKVTSAIWFGSLFAGLTGVFLFILFVVRKQLPKDNLRTTKVKPADKEVLPFLLSYLLPFFWRESSHFSGDVLSAGIVAVFIGLIVFHSSAYTFNPVLAVLGYHFYEVESGGMTYLLISGKHIARPENELVVRHLCDYIYFDET